MSQITARQLVTITLNAIYSKIARFYDVSVPTSIVISETDKVSQWKDRSVYQQHATQVTTENQPIYDNTNKTIETGNGKFLNIPIPSDFNGYIYIANKNEGIIRLRLNVPSLSPESRTYIQTNGLSFGGYEDSPIVGIVFYAESTIILQDEAIIINYLKLTGGSRGSWRTISDVSERFRSDQPSNKLFEFVSEIPKQENAILNLSAVVIAEYLFYGMKGITQLPSDLNFSNAVNIAYLVGETLLTQFPLYNTEKVANFEGAWYNCPLLSTFPLLNTSSGTNFSYSWQNCTSLYANQPWGAKLNFSEAVQLSATWSNNRFTAFPDYFTGSDYNNNFNKVTSFLNTWSNNPNLNNFKKINTISGQNFDGTWFECIALSNIEPLDMRSGVKFSNTWNNAALTAESVDNALISIAAGLANNPTKIVHFPSNTLIGNNNQKPTITNRRATNNWEAWEAALKNFGTTGYNFSSGVSGLQAKQWMVSEFGVDIQVQQPTLDAVSGIINTVFTLDDLTKIVNSIPQHKLVISQESIQLGNNSIWLYTDSTSSYALPQGFRPQFSGATNLVIQIANNTTINAATIFTVTAISGNSITLSRTSGVGTIIPANSRVYFGSTSKWLNTTVAITVNAGTTISLNADTTVSTTPPEVNDTGYLPQSVSIKPSQFSLTNISLRENTIPISGTISQWNPLTGTNIVANQNIVNNQPILTTNTSANYVIDFNNKTFTFTFNNTLNNGRLYVGTTKNSILEFNLSNQVNGNTFSFGINENIPITGLIFINTQSPTTEQETIIRTYLVSRGSNPLTQFDANNPTEFAAKTDFTERFKGDDNSLYSKIITFPGVNTAAGTNFQSTWQNASALTTFNLVPNTAAGINFQSTWQNCIALITFPAFNTAAGTNFQSTWQGCTALVTFNPVPNTAAGTNFQSAWQGCTALITFPAFNTATGTNFQSAWQGCTALVTFNPVPNTAAGTSFQSAWQNCIALVTFPSFNTAAGTNFQSAWQGCTELTTFTTIPNTASGTNFQSAWQGCTALIIFPAINTSSAITLENTWKGCSALTTFPAINTISATNISGTWNNAALTAESVDNALISIAAGLAANPNKIMILPVDVLIGSNNKSPESINRRATNNWETWETALSQATDTGYNFSGGVSGLQARQWILGKFGINVPLEEPSLASVSSIIYAAFSFDDLTKIVSSTPQRKLVISQESITQSATSIWLYADSTSSYALPQGFRPQFSGATNLVIQIASNTTINAATIYTVTAISGNSITLSRTSGTGTTIPANSRVYFGSTSKWLNTTVAITVDEGTTISLNADTTVSTTPPEVNDIGYLPQLVSIKYPQIAVSGLALRENTIPISSSISQWNPQTGTNMVANQNTVNNQPSLTTAFSTNYVIDFNNKTLTFTFNNNLVNGKVYVGTSRNSILDFNLSSQSGGNTFSFGFGENVPITGLIFINTQDPTTQQESTIRNYLIGRGANPLTQFDGNNPTEFAAKTNFAERFTGVNNSFYNAISTFPSINTAAGTNFQSTWQGCTALTTFTTIPNTAAGINFQSAWQGCSSLITFPAFNTATGTNFQSAWQGCTALTTFTTIPNTAAGINFQSAWQGCTALTTFPAFNTATGTNFQSAWQGCTALTTFTAIPNTAAGINFQSAWQGCSSLITFPAFNTATGTNFQSAWQGCTALVTFNPVPNTAAGTNFQSAWQGCTALTIFPAFNTATGTNFQSAWQGCTTLTTFNPINLAAGTNFNQAWYQDPLLSQESVDNILVSLAAGMANNPTKFFTAVDILDQNKGLSALNRRVDNNPSNGELIWQSWETALKNVADIGYDFSGGVSGLQAKLWMLFKFGIDVPVQEISLDGINSIIYAAFVLNDLTKITVSTPQRKLIISQESITQSATSIWLYTDSTSSYALPQGFRPQFSGATNLVIQIANDTTINAATIYTVTAITGSSITLSRTSGVGATIPANSRIYFGSTSKWLNTTVAITVDEGTTISLNADTTVSTTPPEVNDIGYLPQLITIQPIPATVSNVALRENTIPISSSISQWNPQTGTNMVANQNTVVSQPILTTSNNGSYAIDLNGKTFTFTFNANLSTGKAYIGTTNNSILEFNLASQSSSNTFSFGVNENILITSLIFINTQSPTTEQESVIRNYLIGRGSNPLTQFDSNNPTEFSNKNSYLERFIGSNNSFYARVISFPLINTINASNLQSTWQNCTTLATFPPINTTLVTNLENTWNNCNLSEESIDNALISIAAGLANNRSKLPSITGTLTGGSNKTPTITNRRVVSNPSSGELLWQSWEQTNLSGVNTSLRYVTDSGYTFSGGVSGLQARQWMLFKFGINIPVQEPSLSSVSSIIHAAFTLDDLNKVFVSTPLPRLVVSQDSIQAGSNNVWVYANNTTNYTLLQGLRAEFATPVTTTQLVGSVYSGVQKYSGIALAPNGRLYCAPQDATQVLEITPLAGGGATTQLVGSVYSGVQKYSGIALAPNGRLYCTPFYATQVLEITPLAGGGATTQLVGSVYSGSAKYSGIALAPNGRLYCAPYNATQVLEITPLASGGATTQLVGSGTGNAGIALAPNGRLYCTPYTATQVLEITPLAGGGATTQLVGSVYNGSEKYHEIALAPNGRLYCAPFKGTQVLEITPLAGGGATTQLVGSGTGNTGIALAPNGRLYCDGRNATQVLEITPLAGGGATTQLVGSVYSDGAKYYGITLAPNGRLYCAPDSATQVLEINVNGNNGSTTQIASNTTINAATTYTVTAITGSSITLSRTSGTGTTIPANSRVYFGSTSKWLNTTVAITVNAGTTISLNANTTVSTTPPAVNDIGYLPQLVAIQPALTAIPNSALRENLIPVGGSISQWSPQSGTNMSALQTAVANQPILTNSNTGNYAIDFNGETLIFTFNSALNNGRVYIGTTLNAVLEFNITNQSANSDFVFGNSIDIENIPITGIIFINTQSPTAEQISVIRNYLVARGSNPLNQFDINNPTEFANKTSFDNRFIGSNNSLYSDISTFPAINTISATSFDNTWQDCTSLTDDSLDSILINLAAGLSNNPNKNFSTINTFSGVTATLTNINRRPSANEWQEWESVDNTQLNGTALRNRSNTFGSGDNQVTYDFSTGISGQQARLWMMAFTFANNNQNIINTAAPTLPAVTRAYLISDGSTRIDNWSITPTTGTGNATIFNLVSNPITHGLNTVQGQANSGLLFSGFTAGTYTIFIGTIQGYYSWSQTLAASTNYIWTGETSGVLNIIVVSGTITSGTTFVQIVNRLTYFGALTTKAKNSTNFLVYSIALSTISSTHEASYVSFLNTQHNGISSVGTGFIWSKTTGSLTVASILSVQDNTDAPTTTTATLSSTTINTLNLALAPIQLAGTSTTTFHIGTTTNRYNITPNFTSHYQGVNHYWTARWGDNGVRTIIQRDVNQTTPADITTYLNNLGVGAGTASTAAVQNYPKYAEPLAAQPLQTRTVGSGATTTSIPLSSSVTLNANTQYNLEVSNQVRRITTGTGTVTTIVVDTALSSAPASGTTVHISAINLNNRLNNFTPISYSTPTTQLVGSVYSDGIKYYGITLASNGRLYCVPSYATQVLEITPLAGGGATTQLVGSVYSGVQKYSGIALAPNGRLYCAPQDATQVLEITPLAGGGATTQLVGSVYSGVQKYSGIALAPNGRLYCTPYNATQVLEITPLAGGGATTQLVGSVYSGSTKYHGIALAPNGRLYCTPFYATQVLEITPLAGGGATTQLVGSVYSGSAKYSGIALAPNGRLYCTPYTATQVLEITPLAGGGATTQLVGSVYSGSGKYHEIALAPNGRLYCAPFFATQVLEITPLAGGGATTQLVGSGTGNAGIALAPNGRLYCDGRNATQVLEINVNAPSNWVNSNTEILLNASM